MTKTELQTVAAPIAAALAATWAKGSNSKKEITPAEACRIGMTATLIASSVITATEGATDHGE